MKVATLGTGCFWCTEAVFESLKGVESAVPGYSGGHVENPTYEQVCAKTTGHAEVVHITYNPSEISFEELLDVFWRTHNPTLTNKVMIKDLNIDHRFFIIMMNKKQLLKLH